MNGERDFLRWISANDALLAIAALAMMQRKEERGEGREEGATFNHLSRSDYLPRRMWRGGRGGWRWMEWPEGFRIANNFILD